MECRFCKILQQNEASHIGHLGNKHSSYYDINGLYIHNSSLLNGNNNFVRDYKYSSQDYFEKFVKETHFPKKLEIDFKNYI